MGWPAGKTRSWKTTGDSGTKVVSSRRGAASSRYSSRTSSSSLTVMLLSTIGSVTVEP